MSIPHFANGHDETIPCKSWDGMQLRLPNYWHFFCKHWRIHYSLLVLSVNNTQLVKLLLPLFVHHSVVHKVSYCITHLLLWQFWWLFLQLWHHFEQITLDSWLLLYTFWFNHLLLYNRIMVSLSSLTCQFGQWIRFRVLFSWNVLNLDLTKALHDV